MSSATRADVARARNDLNNMPGPIPDKEGPTDTLTERQIQLNWYWGFYRATCYDHRAVDWNGRPSPGTHIEREMVATSGVIPPGFYDAGQTMALSHEYRRPNCPVYLGRMIPNRFTSLLFSARRHPKLISEDPNTEDWLNGFAEATRLWSNMKKARRYGGAMGTACFSFKFVKGKPVVEVHDPRHCTPVFSDRSIHTVASIEKRYQYVLAVRNEEGRLEDRWFWYRRVIDDMSDTVWPKVAVDEEEPNWETERHVTAEHGLGECPVFWVQNEEVEDDIDGDPDCHGAYDMIERVDGLYSQANRGTIRACEPRVVIKSDAEFDSFDRSGDNATQVESGGDVEYLEMAGTGIDRAVSLAKQLTGNILALTRCVLGAEDNVPQPQKTATEALQDYSAMYERVDEFREQYGEMGVKRLLEMALRAARKLAKPTATGDNVVPMVKRVVILPPKKVVDEKTGKVSWVERQLGEGQQVELKWPDLIMPTPESISAKVDAAGKAKTFGLIDQKHASNFVAEDFHVENTREMIENIKIEEKASAAAEGFGGGNDLASKVSERTLAGSKSALPNPTARIMQRDYGRTKI